MGLRQTLEWTHNTQATSAMHPDAIKTLSWSNSAARNKLLKRLVAERAISEHEELKIKVVIQIRHEMHQNAVSHKRQDDALEDLRTRNNLSRKSFHELCSLAHVCVADGKWYLDLDHKLRQQKYRVPRKIIKKFDHLKLCMVKCA
ncbi:MAG: hypothetical protein CL678_00475 [Bdellovibrionaceae bacterium]|nr:hypothetical protein [Pseudobdellovibrionaceae bacterium]|tara:strand:- start:280 stop:714 length:435 start_codon:yes stop_codon:yes gene_type:complete